MVKHSVVKHSVVKHSSVKHSVVKHSVVEQGMVKHSVVEHGTVEHSMAKHAHHDGESHALPQEPPWLHPPHASEGWLRRAEEVPHCMREPFILGGYRPPIPHWRGVAGTLLRWHNQTGEIYTHLLPLIAYTAAGVWTIAELPPAATAADALLFALYFGGVATCFACSALYHLGACHSELWHDRLYRVDRAGIVAPFFASMVFLTYYTFACAPIYRALHIGAAVVRASLRRVRARKRGSLGLDE